MPLEDKKKFTGNLKTSIIDHPRALLTIRDEANKDKFRIVTVPEGCVAFMKAETTSSTPLAERSDSTIHRTGKAAPKPRHGLGLGFIIQQEASSTLET